MERLAAHEGGRLAGNADGELDLAGGRAPAHRMIAVIGAVEIVVGVDVQAVRALEDALAPGAQEIALAVEHHHGVLAAIEDVDLVLAVDGDGADVHELPVVGKLGPVLHHPIAMLATAQHNRHCSLPGSALQSIGTKIDRRILPADGFRQMTLAAGVLDQDHLAGADDPALAVAGGDLHAAVEVDDVLAAGCGMPVEIVVAGGLAEDDAGGRQPRRVLAELPLLDPLHLDVAKVRFALCIDVEIVNAHAVPPRSSLR